MVAPKVIPTGKIAALPEFGLIPAASLPVATPGAVPAIGFGRVVPAAAGISDFSHTPPRPIALIAVYPPGSPDGAPDASPRATSAAEDVDKRKKKSTRIIKSGKSRH